MAFNDLKITTAEINTNNVKSADDTYSADDIQRNKDIFDRLPELIAARVNGLIDQLTEELAGIYTKEEVADAINNKIVEMGTGDMAKGVYDTDGDGKVNAADAADKLGAKVKIGNAYFDGGADITLAEMGAATAAQGTKIDKLTTDITAIKYVTALPSNPDANTLYLVKK